MPPLGQAWAKAQCWPEGAVVKIPLLSKPGLEDEGKVLTRCHSHLTSLFVALPGHRSGAAIRSGGNQVNLGSYCSPLMNMIILGHGLGR